MDYLDQNQSKSLSSISTLKNADNTTDIKPKKYYKIVTKINLQIPIISNIFDFKFFYIYGNTKSFEVQ